MRRHRSKIHDLATKLEAIKSSSAAGASNTAQLYIVPEGFREDFTVEQEDTSFTPQPRKLSPSSSREARDSNFSADKLKRLGVINPEAFCEICCKEYCNKYFLKTHKIKRHGIYLDESKEDHQQTPSAIMNRSPWQFVQTSPLNLMMGTVAAAAAAAASADSFYQRREMGELRKVSVDSLDDFAEPKRIKLDEDAGKPSGNGDEKSELERSQEADAISVDLQKLQSMILQLNDLNAQRPATCGLCGKELDNQYALHAHMMHAHSNAGGENNNGIKMEQPMHCKQCDNKEFASPFALQQHLFEVHGQQVSSGARSPASAGIIGSDAAAMFARPDSRPTQSTPPTMVAGASSSTSAARPYIITPTSSYCEICNKELCNKYFMKTHMQRMHGIEIENGAQIGGVICNICNKELCSKYFLRVHKHNTHGIVEEGSPLPQPRNQSVLTEAGLAISQLSASAIGGGEIGSGGDVMFPMDLKPGEINELSSRYFTHFTEVCPLCNRRFRGSKWLRTHLMSDHGKCGTDKLREIEQQLGLAAAAANSSKPTSPTLKIPNGNGPFGGGGNIGGLPDSHFMHKPSLTNLFAGEEPVSSTSSKPKEYQCSFCAFSTPSYAFLFIHERSHMSVTGANGSSAPTPSNGSQTNATQPNQVVSTQQQQQQQQNAESTTVQEDSHHKISGGSASGGGGVRTRTPSQSSSETGGLCTPPPTIPTSSPPPPLPPPRDESIADDNKHQSRRSSPGAAENPYNILVDVANLTKRPAAYAVPQASDGIVMQSFLMEQVQRNGGTGNTSPSLSVTAPSSGADRFVPSLVFLPVKQRVSDKMIVSFTLTPA